MEEGSIMRKISVMVSSVINGLEAERDAVKEAFSGIEFVDLIGAEPFNNTALSGSSAFSTVQMAKECDVYFLILSERYGKEILGGQSATEAEFDAAVKDDPTKIMVFLKDSDKKPEPKQKSFIDKVSNYYSGYFRPKFKYSHQLKEMAINSFNNWLIDRAQLKTKLNYIDHFIRIAKQILPADNAKVFYRTTENDVELEYKYLQESFIIQFRNDVILKNFWNCVNDLQIKCNEWAAK